jgi:hypothetical protein
VTRALSLALALRAQAVALRAQADALDGQAAALETEAHPGAVECFTSVALPPRTSRRAFAERCRSGRVQGARRIGSGRGSTWTCATSAWWQSLGTVVAAPAAPKLRLVESDEEIAARAIARGGRR